MNDIQAEVNFFELFDGNYKPKVLNCTNTQNLLQKENKATHRQPRLMITNHANQQIVADNMYLTKKQMQTINRTTKNWLKS